MVMNVHKTIPWAFFTIIVHRTIQWTIITIIVHAQNNHHHYILAYRTLLTVVFDGVNATNVLTLAKDELVIIRLSEEATRVTQCLGILDSSVQTYNSAKLTHTVCAVLEYSLKTLTATFLNTLPCSSCRNIDTL